MKPLHLLCDWQLLERAESVFFFSFSGKLAVAHAHTPAPTRDASTPMQRDTTETKRHKTADMGSAGSSSNEERCGRSDGIGRGWRNMEGKIEREREDEKMEGREEGRQRAKEKIEVRKKRDAGRKEERKREKGVGIIEGRKLRKGIRTGKKKGRKEGWDGGRRAGASHFGVGGCLFSTTW